MSDLRVVVGCCRIGDRLLVQQRGAGRHAGMWELPGGKTEPGETDAEALVREWDEELGVTVHVLSAEPLIAPQITITGHGLVALPLYPVKIVAGVPTARIGQPCIAWLTLDEIRSRPQVPSFRHYIDALGAWRSA